MNLHLESHSIAGRTWALLWTSCGGTNSATKLLTGLSQCSLVATRCVLEGALNGGFLLGEINARVEEAEGLAGGVCVVGRESALMGLEELFPRLAEVFPGRGSYQRVSKAP